MLASGSGGWGGCSQHSDMQWSHSHPARTARSEQSVGPQHGKCPRVLSEVRCPARPAVPLREAGGGAQLAQQRWLSPDTCQGTRDCRGAQGSCGAWGLWHRALPAQQPDACPALTWVQSSCLELRVQLSHLNQGPLDKRDASRPAWRLRTAVGASRQSCASSACCLWMVTLKPWARCPHPRPGACSLQQGATPLHPTLTPTPPKLAPTHAHLQPHPLCCVMGEAGHGLYLVSPSWPGSPHHQTHLHAPRSRRTRCHLPSKHDTIKSLFCGHGGSIVPPLPSQKIPH
ncbi:hypothetical protein HJG60_009565 [Phyllostomus discolor]|uniref:Uncharacterized protein n=1 Tax=Phyllostomus discolor TaxID=89673 RepID=A0A833YI11_9CHIR|nr:hypothetical protein HJG60_009565 [Phyllostomus discolor]